MSRRRAQTGMSGAEIAVIVFVAVMAFWILGAHNRLVRLRQAIKAAFAQVDAQLRQRHELLGELIAAVEEGKAEPPQTLVAVEAARQQARVAADRVLLKPGSSGRMASLVLAEQVLRRAVEGLEQLVAERPALGNEARLRESMAELDALQHRLHAARAAFNAEATAYNASIRQFPTRVVAELFGFRAAGLL